MRRPRTHRLTGSPGRLLAAAALAVTATAAVVTVASAAAGPGSTQVQAGLIGMDGLVGSPTSALPAPSLNSLVPTPSATPLPPLPVVGCVVLCSPMPTPTLLPLSTPPLPSLCVTNCPTGGNPAGPTGGPTPAARPTGSSGPASASSPASVVVAASSPGSSSGPGTGIGAFTGAGVSASVPLDLIQPPPVEQLTPLAGISFGQAPYVWPLILLLDVGGAVAVAIAVRKTWSTPGVD